MHVDVFLSRLVHSCIPPSRPALANAGTLVLTQVCVRCVCQHAPMHACKRIRHSATEQLTGLWLAIPCFSLPLRALFAALTRWTETHSPYDCTAEDARKPAVKPHTCTPFPSHLHTLRNPRIELESNLNTPNLFCRRWRTSVRRTSRPSTQQTMRC